MLSKPSAIAISKAMWNTEKRNVDLYFDTSCYYKKTYKNPILKKVTKSYIYVECEGNQKLRIPRIYDGLVEEEIDKKGCRLIVRIFIWFVIVLIVSIILSIIDIKFGGNIVNFIKSINF